VPAERLTTTHPDVLRVLLATFIHTLMGAVADALCGPETVSVALSGTNSRNGYRHRQFDIRADVWISHPDAAAWLQSADGLAAGTP
jgi:transposase-like protein